MNLHTQGFLVLIIMLALPFRVSGQTEIPADNAVPGIQPFILDEIAENSAEADETGESYANLAEDLADLLEKPVNLNRAGKEDLRRIPFLSPRQRDNLELYLVTYGEVLSLYELQSVQGFDSVVVQAISPYIVIEPPAGTPPPTPANLARYGRHSLLARVEQSFPGSAGYLDNVAGVEPGTGPVYEGSPQRYYFRYTYDWFDKIRVGLAGEKDPGEQFFRGAQSKGMDYYAGYVSLSNIGILKNLVAGNFKVSYGQGLTMGAGNSMGASPGFPANMPRTSGARPGLAMNEAAYMRGLAATVKAGWAEVSGFVSYHPRDATVTSFDSASGKAVRVSTLSTSGYHRNGKEAAKRKALTELVCGGNLSISMAPGAQFGFRAGITGVYSGFSAKISPPVQPYNRFSFSGHQNLNTGIDLQIRWQGIFLYGEVTRSLNRGMAGLLGLGFSPGQGISIQVIGRNYEPGHQNLYANAFGQNSMNANEKGLYAAISASLNAVLNLSGYFDIFTFPRIKYRTDTPVSGFETGIMAAWQANPNVKISLRYYQKNGRSNAPAGAGPVLHKLEDNSTRSVRFGMEWVAGTHLLLKTRIEMKQAVIASTGGPFGYFVYQEAQYRLKKRFGPVTLRFALFDIPDYASRIYIYEPEVLFGYSVPAFQGKGMRTCMVVRTGISRRVECWLRGGITYYTDREVVGSGPDLTAGSARGEITGQLLVKL